VPGRRFRRAAALVSHPAAAAFAAALVVAAAHPARAGAQAGELPAGAERSPEAAAAFEAASLLGAIAPLAPEAIWPGFRPDTLAVVLSVPEVGWLLTGWPGEPPEGFSAWGALPGVAWRPYRHGRPAEENTVRIEERRWIFYRASGDRAEDLGNLVHEAFHLLEGELRPAGRYPPGENSFRVVSYPEFDAANEAGFGLEGRLLDAALRALPDTAAAAALAREFVAVREARQRRLDPADALFEVRAELNEGVAQYAYVRALRLVAEGRAREAAAPAGEPGEAGAGRRAGGAGSGVRAQADLEAWASDAAAEIASQRELLADLIGARGRSIRLRFYATGFAQGLLLDALMGGRWKDRVMDEGAALQDLLAEASGYRAQEATLVERASARHPGVEAAATAAVESLSRDRMDRVEEALSGPGVRIDIDASALPDGDVGFCGIDPQNLLQVGPSRLLHARWFRACGPGFEADMNARVVHDRDEGTLALVVPVDALRVSVDGAPLDAPAAGGSVERSGAVTIEAAGVSIRAERGTVIRSERHVRLALAPPG